MNPDVGADLALTAVLVTCGLLMAGGLIMLAWEIRQSWTDKRR